MKSKIFFTALLAVIAAMISVDGVSLVSAIAEDLVVTCPGGTYEIGWREHIKKRFEQKYPGDRIVTATALTMQAVAKMRVQKDNVEIDAFVMDPVGAAQCEAEGLFEPLTVETVPNLKNLLPNFQEKRYFWTHFFWVLEVLWYNTEQFKTPPQSWKVMFDPKYSGRIAFPDINTSHGVWTLNMAARIYGGSMQNIDPGFEAIKKIRSGIKTFWTIHGEIQQLFARGEVWLTSNSTDRCAAIMKEGVPVNWTVPEEGAYIIAGTVGIAKGTKHLALARRYVDFCLDAQSQALSAKHMYTGIVVKGVAEDPEMVKAHFVPTAKDLDKALDLDWTEVNKVRHIWIERWRREVVVK